jgi:hypothetical protein
MKNGYATFHVAVAVAVVTSFLSLPVYQSLSQLSLILCYISSVVYEILLNKPYNLVVHLHKLSPFNFYII